jgi:hypothetical protein
MSVAQQLYGDMSLRVAFRYAGGRAAKGSGRFSPGFARPGLGTPLADEDCRRRAAAWKPKGTFRAVGLRACHFIIRVVAGVTGDNNPGRRHASSTVKGRDPFMTPPGGPCPSRCERRSERRTRDVRPSQGSYFGGRAARLLPDAAGHGRARAGDPGPGRAGAEGGPRRLTHAALQPERRHPERPEDSRPVNLRGRGAPPGCRSGEGERP